MTPIIPLKRWCSRGVYVPRDIPIILEEEVSDMPKSHLPYPRDFKRRMVELVRAGRIGFPPVSWTTVRFGKALPNCFRY
jgi:hypothetical protein